jgi:hypothetical protein
MWNKPGGVWEEQESEVRSQESGGRRQKAEGRRQGALTGRFVRVEVSMRDGGQLMTDG